MGLRFRRQMPIGPYTADFVCIEKRLVIEVDGGQHGPHVHSDRGRYVRDHDFGLLRFWNNDVLGNVEGVCEMIMRHLRDTHPHPNLPPQAGEGDKL